MPAIEAEALTPLELEYEYHLRQMDANQRPLATTVEGYLNLQLREDEEVNRRHPFRGDTVMELERCIDQARALASRVVDIIVMNEWTGSPTTQMRPVLSRLRHYYERLLRIPPNQISEAERLVVRSTLQRSRQMMVTGAPFVEQHNASVPMVAFDHPNHNSTVLGTPMPPVRRNIVEPDVSLIDLISENDPQSSRQSEISNLPRTVEPTRRPETESNEEVPRQSEQFAPNLATTHRENNRQPSNPVPCYNQNRYRYETQSPPVFHNQAPSRPMARNEQEPRPMTDFRSETQHRDHRMASRSQNANSQARNEYMTRNEWDLRDNQRFNRASTPVFHHPTHLEPINRNEPGRSQPHVRFDIPEHSRSAIPQRDFHRSMTPGRNNTSAYQREANRDNAQEQLAMRKWLQNKFFDGTPNGMKVEQFLTTLRDYQAAQEVSDSVILRNLAQSMAGDAATWWRGRSRFIENMEDFERQFRGRFAPQTQDADDVVRAIHNRKQGEDEYVQKYLDDILELMQRLPMGYFTEPQQIATVLRGFNSQMYPLFLTRPFTSIKELLDYALQLTRNQDVSRRFRPRPRYVNTMEAQSDGSEENESEEMAPWENALVCLVKAAKQAVRRPNQKPKQVAVHDTNPSGMPSQSSEPRKQEYANAQEKAVADKLFNTKIGDLPVRCDNCLARGHRHQNCPFPAKMFCYGCGEPGITVNQCKPCQSAKAQRQAKNETSCLESTEQTPEPL